MGSHTTNKLLEWSFLAAVGTLSAIAHTFESPQTSHGKMRSSNWNYLAKSITENHKWKWVGVTVHSVMDS